MAEMKIEMRAVDSLIPYARNPRKNDHAVDSVAASIKEFGFKVPIVLDSDGVIVTGHTRLKAAKKLGLKEVPTITADDLTPDQIKAFRLLDNKIGEKAEWEAELLSMELSEIELDLAPFDVDFSLNLEEPESPEITEDEAPEPQPLAVSKLGDVWLLGDHRLMCGDSTNKDEVSTLFAGGRAVFLFTSPPYLEMRDYEGGKELSVSHLSRIFPAWLEFSDHFCVNLGIARKESEVVTYWDEWIKGAKDAGLKLLSWNVWNKDTAGSVSNQNAMFSIVHEWIFVFGKAPRVLNRIIPNDVEGNAKRRKYDRTDENGNALRLVRQKDGSTKESIRGETFTHKQIGTVQSINPEMNRSIDHPAMFPLELPSQYILSFCNAGEAVAEPFSGSGSTLVAAEQTGRRCFAMELEPRYVDVAIRRWQKITGKDATLEATGETFNERESEAFGQ